MVQILQFSMTSVEGPVGHAVHLQMLQRTSSTQVLKKLKGPRLKQNERDKVSDLFISWEIAIVLLYQLLCKCRCYNFGHR